jgi:hypothetical protein
VFVDSFLTTSNTLAIGKREFEGFVSRLLGFRETDLEEEWARRDALKYDFLPVTHKSS